MDRNASRAEGYRRWIHDRRMAGWEEWAARMREIEASSVRCRLCHHIAARHALALPQVPWSPQHLAQVRARRSTEAARIFAAEDVRRRGLSHASKVKVEL